MHEKNDIKPMHVHVEQKILVYVEQKILVIQIHCCHFHSPSLCYQHCQEARMRIHSVILMINLDLTFPSLHLLCALSAFFLFLPPKHKFLVQPFCTHVSKSFLSQTWKENLFTTMFFPQLLLSTNESINKERLTPIVLDHWTVPAKV